MAMTGTQDEVEVFAGTASAHLGDYSEEQAT